MQSHDRKTESIQSQTWQRETSEPDPSPSERFSQGWDRAAITSLWGSLSRGITGENWSSAFTSVAQLLVYQSSISGGIVAQLISDVQDRLGKAEECVAWYQREIVECQNQLERLQAIADSIIITSEELEE